jgi:hypothetical protein
MPSETTARASPLSDAPTEGEYRAFCEVLSASTRGRAFLAEYARRNRNADTEQLLVAIDALQSLMSAKAATQASEPVRYELRALLDEISAAQSELEASMLAIKATKLAELTALVERRISNILASLHAEPSANLETPPLASSSPHEPTEEPERTHLAVVPLPEQPELPIPSPAASQPPSIALVRSQTIMAEVAFVEHPPGPHVQSDKNSPEAISMRSGEPAIATADEKETTTKIVSSSTDPLASIMALSEEERLALFT